MLLKDTNIQNKVFSQQTDSNILNLDKKKKQQKIPNATFLCRLKEGLPKVAKGFLEV